MASKSSEQPTAVQIVWQWVCYGLWEWTLIALSTLLSATLAYFFVNKDAGFDFVIYVLAAVICLLPLAFAVDRIYTRREPDQKHGFSGVVMVLNAVLVFLATVGGLIVAVVNTLALVVEANPSDGKAISIISSLVVVVLGSMLFVRIINPDKLRSFSKVFAWVVLGVAGATIVLSIAGPVRGLVVTRDDRLIEQNLSMLSNEISNYTNDHRKLPGSLGELNFDGSYQSGAQNLVKRNLVTYEPNTKASTTNDTYATGSSTQHYYKLCVTYNKPKGNGIDNRKEIYTISSDHGTGRVCYDLMAEAYVHE